jgi:branched-chain amino acid transport system substrate-binding protein
MVEAVSQARRNRMAKYVVVLLGLVSLWSFADSSPARSEAVKVGVILPLTGKLGNIGQMAQRAFVQAAKEINTRGGVNGQRLELFVADTAGNPRLARDVIQRLLLENQVAMVVGGVSSSVAWAAAASCQERKLPFLITTAAADKITEQGWTYVFRLNTPSGEYSRAMEGFLKELGEIRSVAILHENTLFGYDTGREWLDRFRKLGLRISIKWGYDEGTTDFRPALTRVADKDSDMIYMISRVNEAAMIMRQIQELGLNARLFAGGTQDFLTSSFRDGAGEASEYVCSTALWTPSVPYPGARSFYDQFLQKQGLAPDYHGAQAHAALQVIADAMGRARSFDGSAVQRALSGTDVMTVYGPVRFVSYGRKAQQNRLPTFLVQWQNGIPEIVWPRDLATAGYVFPAPPWGER